MKFSTTLALSTVFIGLVAGNEMGCVSTIEEGKDYFPNKVTAEESQFWSVDYESSYKIVSNTAAGETYLLYQCGTLPPAEELDGRHAAVFSVPLDSAALLSTTMIPFLEIIGAREKIGAYLGSRSWVTSPCLSDLFDDGLVEEVTDYNNASNIENIPLDFPAFVGTSGDTALENEIRISSEVEETNLAVFEWVKFYSLFFNMEEMANEIFSATKQRYNCAEENAALLACDNEKKPVVLWGSWSTFCGGWDVAVCPNYYCEFAENCQAELLNSDDRGSIYSEDCFRNYMTLEEFVAFGKDADIWIYTSPDFDTMYAEFQNNLTDFVSIQNEKVYDTEGQGAGTWFEQRLAEPDVVLQDFCNVVGRQNLAVPTPHQRAWFRNVFTEAVGTLDQCEDPSAPLVTKATECVALPSNYCESSSGGDGVGSGDTSPSSASSINYSLSSSLGLLAILVMYYYC